MKKDKLKGFTLIELLVVIAIIGLLSTLAVVALSSARTKARDAKRQSDLKILQTAIELYITDKGNAPTVGNGTSYDINIASPNDGWDGGTNDLKSVLASYLPSGLPEDPSTTARDWIYCADDTGTDYMVATSLEQNITVTGDIDSVSNWTTSECVASDDGSAPGNTPNCSDNDGGTIDDDTSVTAVCLGSDDNT